ncbi:MAG: right-handed parallel beta-helix repeat-containing protein, partial [Planctomycetes bacterium]|nr:right-handed parallel beta-helix repeat-containing protein [Planctomycetota bacterium]
YNNKQEGFYNSNSGDYNVIRKNYSHDNGSAGFHNNGDISMGGDGILSNSLIENNISARNGTPGTDLSFDGIERSVVRNNLCYGTGKGIALYGIDAAIASRHNHVYNNTFVMPKDAWYAVVIRNHNPGRPDAVGNKLFNNIFYHRSTRETVGSICMDKSAEEGFESDYNVVVEHFGIDDNAQILTFAQWQELGYDKHSLQASEADLFVDPVHDDYHLKAGSPAIDAGKILEDVKTDLEGTTRPQGAAYDIGCYEAR